MARQRKMIPKRKAFLNSLPKDSQPNDEADAQKIIKDLWGDSLEECLKLRWIENRGILRMMIKTKRRIIAVMATKNGHFFYCFHCFGYSKRPQRRIDPQTVRKNYTDISTIEGQSLIYVRNGKTT